MDEVQVEAANMISTVLQIEHFGPLVLCIISGPLSDRYGRKIPLLASCVGMAATYLGYALLAIFDPHHNLSTIFYILPSIGISLGGQFFVFFQMFFAYTSDISDLRGESANTKFTRFIIAEGSVYFGAVTGSYVGGVTYSKYGYTVVFLAATALITVATVYAAIVMKIKIEIVSENNNNSEEKKKPKLELTKMFLNTFTVAFKKRDGKLKSLLLLSIFSFVLYEVVFPVDDTLLYLHLKGKFNWTEENFTDFQAFWTFCMVVGQFGLTPILQDKVKLSAPLIGLLSCISKGCYYLFLASSSKQWMVYVSAVLGLEGGVGNIVNRSLVARVVSGEELGTVYGLLAILDAVLPFIVCPISTQLYKYTLHILPSAFCLLNAGILLVDCLTFLAMYILIVKYQLLHTSAA